MFILNIDTKVNRENSIRNHSKLVSLKKVDDRKRYLANNNLDVGIGRSVYRTAWLNEHNIRFVKFNKYEDNYFAGIVNYNIGTIYIVPKCLYYYRILEKSNFHSRNDKDHFERLRLNIALIDYYKETQIWDQYYENIRDSFLDAFYINTLHIIFCQFDSVPIDQIKYMQKTVKELFPDYLETIIKPEQGMVQELLLTVEFDHFTVDDWWKMAKYYRAYRGGITSAFDFLLCILWRNWSILQINKQ